VTSTPTIILVLSDALGRNKFSYSESENLVIVIILITTTIMFGKPSHCNKVQMNDNGLLWA
jgi:hypothetical protein